MESYMEGDADAGDGGDGDIGSGGGDVGDVDGVAGDAGDVGGDAGGDDDAGPGDVMLVMIAMVAKMGVKEQTCISTFINTGVPQYLMEMQISSVTSSTLILDCQQWVDTKLNLFAN